MRKIQEFIGLNQTITRESFVIPVDDEGRPGLPCFSQGKTPKADCLGKGDSEKGRSLDKRFTKKVTKILNTIFKPFDIYFANKILKRESFQWTFGME